MYLSHYNLQHMPFEISPDPRFLWLGEKHEEALARMKYGVLNNQGFLVLTGDVGTGKTTLINALLNSLNSDTFIVNVADPRLDKLDFFKLVAHSLGLNPEIRTKFDFLISFKDFLQQAHDSKKTVLLIIDEAQKLSLESLEEIRLFSNIEKQDTKLLNVFFIGQNEFNNTLVRPECRALRQRITIVHTIGALNKKETVEYVKYRLSVAGTQRKIFTDKALNKIYSFSGGYPRIINIICDRALLSGYMEELQTIDHKMIHECARSLSLPGEMGQRSMREVARRTRTSLRRVPSAAIFTGIALFIAVSSYIITSRFLGSDGFSLRKYYESLFVADNRDLPEPSPEKAKTQEPEQYNLFRESKLLIPFGYNVNELPPKNLARLDKLASYMLRKKDSYIVIRGYTDSVGNVSYNRNLSSMRANVVKGYLAGKGISPSRMKVIGMGAAAPRMPNTTEEGRSANRRTEIELVDHQP